MYIRDDFIIEHLNRIKIKGLYLIYSANSFQVDLMCVSGNDLGAREGIGNYFLRGRGVVEEFCI